MLLCMYIYAYISVLWLAFSLILYHHGVVSYNTEKVSEQLHSHFRVVEKPVLDVIVACDWLQSVSPKVDWVKYGVTLNNGFAAAGVPVYHSVKIELYSFKVFMYLLHPTKLQTIGYISLVSF